MTEVVDPQSLFQQFSPSLYFDSPKTSSKADWYILIEQSVPVAEEGFWKTVKRWTAEPQYAIPPIEKAEIKSSERPDNTTEIIVRQLFPKRKLKDEVLTEKVEYHESEGRVIYQPMVSELPFYYPKVKAYSFVYQKESDQQGTLRLEIMPLTAEAAISDPKMQYALKIILHKLFKWCIQARLGYKKKAKHDVLVPKEEYQSMYQYIKSKYGSDLVENWPEKTDPKKFVYEDLAIASYLLCLWKQEESKTHRKPTFVDLGCGNGLLTYLLVKEGYKGYGVDIADRKIWNSLCKDDKDMLRVQALYPSQALYPEVDWLIGNHADELVPWIPIIASKSGENCKFMVIPCCFYGLDGTKNLPLRVIDGQGKYKAYTDYVKNIASKAGFSCQEDYLRIPSTKNIAILGLEQKGTPQKEELETMVQLASTKFLPRKTDREKDEERRESKKLKLENS